MTDQPLQPFSPPSNVLENLHLSGIVNEVQIVWGILYAVCFYWAVYTIVGSYHWFRYSHGSWLSIPAIALHLFVSFGLITFALTGVFPLHFFTLHL